MRVSGERCIGNRVMRLHEVSDARAAASLEPSSGELRNMPAAYIAVALVASVTVIAGLAVAGNWRGYTTRGGPTWWRGAQLIRRRNSGIGPPAPRCGGGWRVDGACWGRLIRGLRDSGRLRHPHDRHAEGWREAVPAAWAQKHVRYDVQERARFRAAT